jgi:PIN domain nuclease of toxin-antitoxin system
VILLDTHAAIWFATEDGLGKQSQSLANKALAEDRLTISAISFWEIGLLVSKRRLKIDKSVAALRDSLITAGVTEIPLTGDIALRSLDFGNFPGDPADRFIMATAIVHGATLMTADEQLLDWRHSIKRQNARK